MPSHTYTTGVDSIINSQSLSTVYFGSGSLWLRYYHYNYVYKCWLQFCTWPGRKKYLQIQTFSFDSGHGADGALTFWGDSCHTYVIIRVSVQVIQGYINNSRIDWKLLGKTWIRGLTNNLE